MPRDHLYIKITLDRKEKERILAFYKSKSIGLAPRVLNMIREDTREAESNDAKA